MPKIMKNTSQRKSIRGIAALNGIALAAYALSPGSSYAQQTSPGVASVADGKETKEVEQLVEQPKPAKLPFNIYGWIEAGITGNPGNPRDNHNFGQLFTDRANEPLLNQDVDRSRANSGSEYYRVRLGVQNLVHVWERLQV
jgi:hypothetical protein